MQPGNLNTKQSTIHIRNMVSESCVALLRIELERTGFIKVDHVELGKAVITYNEQVFGLSFINEILKSIGFAIIDDHDDKLVEKIKQSVIQLIFFGNNTNTILCRMGRNIT